MRIIASRRALELYIYIKKYVINEGAKEEGGSLPLGRTSLRPTLSPKGQAP